jgi:hypothetical protein
VRAGALCVGCLVGVVRLLLGVESEVILRDLAVAFAFRVGYEELLTQSVRVCVDRGRRRQTRWYPSRGSPFLKRCLA